MRGFFLISLLASYVRKESHKARALYCRCELALACGRNTRPLLALNASMRIQEFLKDLRIFVVDMVDAVFFEEFALHRSLLIN